MKGTVKRTEKAVSNEGVFYRKVTVFSIWTSTGTGTNLLYEKITGKKTNFSEPTLALEVIKSVPMH